MQYATAMDSCRDNYCDSLEQNNTLYSEAFQYALELSGDEKLAERVASRFLDVVREKPELVPAQS